MNSPELEQETQPPQRRPRTRRTVELFAIAAFVLVNLLAPLVVGELYPFTVSPMFSDQPSGYCTYEIVDSGGESLDPELFGVHLVYDGNPPGLGMGIVPTPTLHGFGEICDKQTVSQRVRDVMDKANIAGPVTVRQTCVVGGEPQLKTEIREWVVEKDGT